jgi:hypothetical protein
VRRPVLVLLASLAVACAPDERVGPGCHHGVVLAEKAGLEGAWTYRAFELVEAGGELVPGARTADIPVEVALGESWLDIRALDGSVLAMLRVDGHFHVVEGGPCGRRVDLDDERPWSERSSVRLDTSQALFLDDRAFPLADAADRGATWTYGERDHAWRAYPPERDDAGRAVRFALVTYQVVRRCEDAPECLAEHRIAVELTR